MRVFAMPSLTKASNFSAITVSRGREQVRSGAVEQCGEINFDWGRGNRVSKADINLYGKTGSFHIANEGNSNAFVILVFLDSFCLHGASVEANSIIIHIQITNLLKNLLVAFWTILAA